jgi:hypothetical protein
MTTYCIDSDQLGLTWQICQPGHETLITLYKENKKKLLNPILNQANVEWWNCKQN